MADPFLAGKRGDLKYRCVVVHGPKKGSFKWLISLLTFFGPLGGLQGALVGYYPLDTDHTAGGPLKVPGTIISILMASWPHSGPARIQRPAARAPASAVSPARRGRRHLLHRALFFGEVATSTTRCACPRTPLALSRAPHPPHPPPTLIAHAPPPCTQPNTCLATTTPPHPSRHPLCRRSREVA